MKVFLDANILFSAAQEGSPMRQMVDLLKKRAKVVTSPYAVTEAERNIALKRQDWTDGLRDVLAGIETVSAQADCGDLSLADADRPILAAATAAQCTYLLTGDFQHFGALMGRTVGGVTVVSARLLARNITPR